MSVVFNFKFSNKFSNFKRVIFAIALVFAFLFQVNQANQAEAVTRKVFLEKLLEARGLDWKSAAEDYQKKKNKASKGSAVKLEDAATFMLRTGLVTDSVSAANLKGQVTRREALRWCVQSLGLAFEAGILSNAASSLSFTDIGKLSSFERGSLFVATYMEPFLFAEAKLFRGDQNLTDKEMKELLNRVALASTGLTLEVGLLPLKGMRLDIHRDGVSTGIPKWRVYADGFDSQSAAENAKAFFASQGFEMSAIHPQYEWFLRTAVLDNYGDVRKLVPLINKRGLSPRVVPAFANTDTDILPHYWAILTIDPDLWHLTPIASENGPRAFAPLSSMAKVAKVSAAINAGFFATTGKRKGYPIGTLRVGGELLSKPYTGRGSLGWNNDGEAMFGIVSLFNDALDGEILIDEDGESWNEMPWVIQAGPMLLKDGTSPGNSEGFATSLISARHPRSVVGLTDDGNWFFLVVDGRNGFHASGATISELTTILRSMNIPWALNLDGGGSSELLVNGKIYNFPSEGQERAISYGLGAINAK